MGGIRAALDLLAVFVIPAIVWWVKVQRSLNAYWEGQGATA